jgi:hypothetical protein
MFYFIIAKCKTNEHRNEKLGFTLKVTGIFYLIISYKFLFWQSTKIHIVYIRKFKTSIPYLSPPQHRGQTIETS